MSFLYVYLSFLSTVMVRNLDLIFIFIFVFAAHDDSTVSYMLLRTLTTRKSGFSDEQFFDDSYSRH